MEKPKKKPSASRESPLLWMLVLVLLVTTVVTPFVSFSPEKRLERAVKRSHAEFLQGNEFSFLSDVARDGVVSAMGENASFSYAASLPESAEWVEKGFAGNRRLVLSGDSFSLQSDVLGEEVFSASRSDASSVICDSAFSDAEMPRFQLQTLRTALVAADGELTRGSEVFLEVFRKSWNAGKPELSQEKEKTEIDGKKRSVTIYTYQMDEEGLGKALGVWKSLGKREETKEAYGILRRYLSAVFSSSESRESAERFVSFLLGETEEFQRFEKKLSSDRGGATLSVTVYKERVRSALFRLCGGGEFVLEAKLDLDPDLKNSGTWSASVQACSGKIEHFSLSVRSELTEDSRSALIRKWNYSCSDTVGAVCAEPETTKAEAVFSWGKEKGDLGLRIKLNEEELVLRGELSSYKRGKKAVFALNRVEYGQKQLLPAPLTVTLSKKGEEPRAMDGTELLFPEGAEREEFAQLLSDRFKQLFSE